VQNRVRMPGILGWIGATVPELIFLPLVLGGVVAGVWFLAENPAGTGTGTSDAYGPGAPAQGWVVVMAVLCFAVAGVGSFCVGWCVVLRVRAHRERRNG
jgi:hypothetical protein